MSDRDITEELRDARVAFPHFDIPHRAADEIDRLRARLERAREKISMSKDSFTKLMEATKSGDHGDQIIARHCEAMLRELDSAGGGDE